MILITRPMAQALETQVEIDFLGHNSIVYPLLDIMPIPGVLEGVKGEFDGVIITSQNAASIIQKNNFAKDKSFYLVGGESAAILKDYNIVEVTGEVRELTKKLEKHDFKRLIYLSGDHISQEIEDGRVERIVVYESIAVTHIPAEIMKPIKCILFYSKRTAETFYKLSSNQDLSGCTALCLSQKIADVIDNLGWKEIKVSSSPNEDSLLSLLPLS